MKKINYLNKIDYWTAENTFYLKGTPYRMSKFIAHYEIFKKIKDLKGDVVECGVFRGASFSRFLSFNKIFSKNKYFYGFDAFGSFPKAKNTKNDIIFAKKHDQKVGYGIDVKNLNYLLKKNNYKNFKLIKGDVIETVENLIKKKIKISLLHLDLDVYAATKFCLEKLFPLVVKKGIILIDDYSHIINTTSAVNEFLKKHKKLKIDKLDFPCRPRYIIKK